MEIFLYLAWLVLMPLIALVQITSALIWPTALAETRFWKRAVAGMTALGLVMALLCGLSIRAGHPWLIPLTLGGVAFGLIVYSGRISAEIVQWCEAERDRREDPLGIKRAARRDARDELIGMLFIGPLGAPVQAYIALFFPGSSPEIRALQRWAGYATAAGLLLLLLGGGMLFAPVSWSFTAFAVAMLAAYGLLVYSGKLGRQIEIHSKPEGEKELARKSPEGEANSSWERHSVRDRPL